ncbi:uncharacterized mitochondrial protein-like protein [Tanacetum coccineum]
MTKKFEMSMMGELTYFLGLKIKQDDKGISICQEQYTRNLLKKYEIYDSSSVKTLMVPLNNLGPDLAGARYQANPKESHLIAVKRIFEYLKGMAVVQSVVGIGRSLHLIEQIEKIDRPINMDAGSFVLINFLLIPLSYPRADVFILAFSLISKASYENVFKKVKNIVTHPKYVTAERCDILPPLKKLCPQSLRRGRRANEKMRVLFLHLVLALPSKLWPSSRIPMDLHDWNAALL